MSVVSKDTRKAVKDCIEDDPQGETLLKDGFKEFPHLRTALHTAIHKALSPNDISPMELVWHLSMIHFAASSYHHLETEDTFEPLPITNLKQCTADMIKKLVKENAGKDTDEHTFTEASSSRISNASFSNLIGLEDAKEALRNAFVNPIVYPSLFGSWSKNILFYGPPGTGKTELAAALKQELESLTGGTLQIHFWDQNSSTLKGKFFGESEKRIKQLFTTASHTACDGKRENNTVAHLSIIFIDEFDSLAGSRSSGGDFSRTTVNALLQQMDGVTTYENVAVIAATNYPWEIDPAILRRFSRQILVGVPTSGEIDRMIVGEMEKYFETLSKKVSVAAHLSQWCESKEPTKTDGTTESKAIYKKIITDWSDEWKADQKRSELCTELAKQCYTGSDIKRLVQFSLQTIASEAINVGIYEKVDVPGLANAFHIFYAPRALTQINSVIQEATWVSGERVKTKEEISITRSYNSPDNVFEISIPKTPDSSLKIGGASSYVFSTESAKTKIYQIGSDLFFHSSLLIMGIEGSVSRHVIYMNEKSKSIRFLIFSKDNPNIAIMTNSATNTNMYLMKDIDKMTVSYVFIVTNDDINSFAATTHKPLKEKISVGDALGKIKLGHDVHDVQGVVVKTDTTLAVMPYKNTIIGENAKRLYTPYVSATLLKAGMVRIRPSASQNVVKEFKDYESDPQSFIDKKQKE